MGLKIELESPLEIGTILYGIDQWYHTTEHEIVSIRCTVDVTKKETTHKWLYELFNKFSGRRHWTKEDTLYKNYVLTKEDVLTRILEKQNEPVHNSE